MKKLAFKLALFLMAVGVYAQPGGGPGGGGTSGASVTIPFKSAINAKWKYNETSKVYYVVGVYYCATPAASTYEQMGIFVPAAYMNATANGDGTYTCTINSTAAFNGYTGATAPIVVPVNTGGYAAMSAPSDYTATVATYTNAGFIYLWPGCRGKTHGAPLGVTDLKAATRYYRYLQAEQNAVPGNTGRIFSFGMSGGGAQSAIFGASGNSSLYENYLTAIGAITGYKDNICGSMCWCPVTNLDLGDAAHEWNMGLTRTSQSTANASISKDLAAEFATYVNTVGFKNPKTGAPLTLTATSDGYYQAGSYYEYVMGIINDAIARYNTNNNTNVASYSVSDATALNTFSTTYKKATKGIGAFDNYLTNSTPENILMGIAGTAGHFNKRLGEILNVHAPSYSPAYTTSLAATNVDVVGNDVQKRLMMYTPVYYLINNSTYYNGGGAGSSDVAPFWRIRTGINQSDAPLNTEINLALALQNHAGVKDVDFATVWGQAHVLAEDNGTSAADANFIAWVNKCVASTTTSSQNIKITDDAVKAYSFDKKIYIMGELKDYNAMLININGSVVRNYKLTTNGQTTIDETGLIDGVYILRVSKGNNLFTFKLIL
ncbi:MAG: T9SS type A sorting domain-containing protein [Prolixibacteraceae bacterium]|nr:T9SS type A sorting domain-containing protein [Prolixibacteraceae bacterium]